MQAQASIVVTGLPIEDCGDFCAACSSAGSSWVYTTASELLAAPAPDGPLIFWLYRAPWQVLPGAVAADDWLALHRRLLRQRAAFGQRLVLVNADAETPQSILSALGLTRDGAAPLLPQAPASTFDVEVAALLAKAFDWAAPEYWDVFEALESAAAATGRDPLFRNTLQAPAALHVSVLRSLVLEGALAPVLKADLLAQQQDVRQSQVRIKALESENERLMLQVHQVQEEAEKVFFDSREKAASAEKARVQQAEVMTSLRADLARQTEKVGVDAASLAKLGADLATREQSLKEAKEALAKAQTELASRAEALKKAQAGEQALTQELQAKAGELATAAKQREVDVAGLAKLGADLATREQSLKEAKEALAKAQTESASRAEALKKAQAGEQALTQELKTKEQALTKAQQLSDESRQQISELTAENDLLLSQLHQTQEELEQVFLDKRQLAAGAEKAQAELAGRMASLQAEVQQQADKLVVGVAAMAQKVKAEQVANVDLDRLKSEVAETQVQCQKLSTELQLRDNALKQSQGAMVKADTELALRAEALKKAQAGEQALTQQLQTKVGELASVGKQREVDVAGLAKLGSDLASREQSLKEANDAVAKAHVELLARAEALTQAQAAQHQLNQELRTSRGALAAAQQLADQGLVQHKALEGENELLLLQLHQVQVEMERYFLENRQLQQVMGQTHHSLDRARHLISRLMLPAREPALTLQAGAAALEGSVTASP